MGKDLSYYEELFEVEKVRYRPISVDDLRYKSGLRRAYIVELYRGFKQECPAGTVDEHDFISIFSKYYPQGDASAFARRVFRHIDAGRRGYMTFEDFLLFLSKLTVHGTDEQRLKFCFKLYDGGGKGYLTESDLSAVVEEIHTMRGFDPALGFDMPPLERVQCEAKALFKKFDVNRDGRVSQQEFITTCMQDKVTVDSMQVFVLRDEAEDVEEGERQNQIPTIRLPSAIAEVGEEDGKTATAAEVGLTSLA